MSLDHEQIEELLAGYALLSLSGEDAIRADRLLADHVPSCPACRQTLAGFQAVAGELALSADPAPLPDLVLPRIHQRMAEVPLAGRSPRRGAFVALAASIVALVAMGGLSFSLGSRVSRIEAQRGQALEILSAMRSPGVTPVNLVPQGQTPPETGIVEVSAPDVRRIYLAADHVPAPAPGHAYQLWLGSNGVFEPIGDMFLPVDGIVLLELTVDVARYDEIWITEEVAGSRPARPSSDGHSWRASL